MFTMSPKRIYIRFTAQRQIIFVDFLFRHFQIGTLFIAIMSLFLLLFVLFLLQMLHPLKPRYLLLLFRFLHILQILRIIFMQFQLSLCFNDLLQRIQKVFHSRKRLQFALHQTVALFMFIRTQYHLLNLVLSQPAFVIGNNQIASALLVLLIQRSHIQDTVLIHTKRHFDLRHSTLLFLNAS
mmetsp:Transcript_16904/g.26923  ORF Transcript_16904/g.26923 Transcript_16904/m.26923 type:complete len:182 (-) Transcript_16904:313-858(-)